MVNGLLPTVAHCTLCIVFFFYAMACRMSRRRPAALFSLDHWLTHSLTLAPSPSFPGPFPLSLLPLCSPGTSDMCLSCAHPVPLSAQNRQSVCPAPMPASNRSIEPGMHLYIYISSIVPILSHLPCVADGTLISHGHVHQTLNHPSCKLRLSLIHI